MVFFIQQIFAKAFLGIENIKVIEMSILPKVNILLQTLWTESILHLSSYHEKYIADSY